MRNMLRLVIALFLGASLATGSRAAVDPVINPITGIVQFFGQMVTTQLTFISPFIYTTTNIQSLLFKTNLGTPIHYGPFSGPGEGSDENGVGSLSTNGNGESVLAVYSGKLTLNLPNGDKLVVQGGQGAVLDKDGNSKGGAQSLSTLMANPAYKAQLLSAANGAAAMLSANTDASKSAELTRALAAVVQTIAEADPALAQSLVESTVSELTKGGKSDEATLKSINVVVAAAANGSKEDKSTLTGYALIAAGKNGADGVTTTSLSNANTQQGLSSVFTAETASSSIDITVVSPSSP